MFVACGIWCLADVSSVSPSSEQTESYRDIHNGEVNGNIEFYSVMAVEEIAYCSKTTLI